MPGGGSGTVTVDGDVIRLVIHMPQIGNPDDFYWKCVDLPGHRRAVPAGEPRDGACLRRRPALHPGRAHHRDDPAPGSLPVGPATGQLVVELRDAAGNLLPNEEHDLAFHSTNGTVATVDANGLVTALTPPQEHWQTPYIEAWGDGVMAYNSAVIRVTHVDLGLTWQMYPAPHVSFYLVPLIEGVDLDAITRDYEVVAATERAYAEQSLIGTVPDLGTHQYLVLDVTNDPVTSRLRRERQPHPPRLALRATGAQQLLHRERPAEPRPAVVRDLPRARPQLHLRLQCLQPVLHGPSGQHNFDLQRGAGLPRRPLVLEGNRGGAPGPRRARGHEHRGAVPGLGRQLPQRLEEYVDAGSNYDTIDPTSSTGSSARWRRPGRAGVWFDR